MRTLDDIINEGGSDRYLNLQVKDAIIMMVDRYKSKKGIFPYECLAESDIAEILGGIKDVIHMYEGTQGKKR